MAATKYRQVSEERYHIICNRYQNFLDNIADPNKEIVRVFDPLAEHLVKDLELIREVSKGLQKKKEDDMAKAAQAAKIAEEEAAKREEEKKEEQNKEESSEEKPEENNKTETNAS